MIKKLLAATSVAALIVGGANAQLALEQTVVPGATISAPYVLASEVDFAALNASPLTGFGQFGLNVLTEGVIPPGQNIFLTINISNGTIATNLDGSEFGGGLNGDGGITGAVVNAGGTVGSTSVRYLITTDGIDLSTTGAGRDGVSLVLPVRASSCGDVTFTVTEFATETGATPIEGGSAVLTTGLGAAKKATPALTCKSAFAATLAPDAVATILDQDATPVFSDFTAGPNTSIVGNFNMAVTPSVYRDLGGANLALPGHVTGYTADIDFTNPAGIASATAVATAGALFAATANVTGSDINLVGTTAATATPATGTVALNLTATGAPVAAQKVTVSDAVLTLDTSLGYKATDAFVSADVEDLIYEGSTFGPFDWVSDSTKAVNSIFRITGLPTATDTPLQIIVENARNGAAFNGVYQSTILGSSVQGSEVRVNSAQLEAIAGQFGTADITMVFSVGDPALATSPDLDVDRLNASPSASVVTPFGDGANQDGSGQNSLTPASTNNDDDGNF